MKSRVLIITVSLIAFAAILSGCSNHDGNEWERLVCEVQSINGGAPLLSAYLDTGSDPADPADDTYPIDWVPVIFQARPYNTGMILPEDSPYSWFHITNYDLTWVPGPNCPAEITNFNITNGLCEAVVESGDVGSVSVLVADRTMKEQPWYRQLYDVPGTSFTAACQLTFKGHESGNTRVVTIESGLMVTFWGAITDN